MAQELVLSTATDAVPQARRFTTVTLTGQPPELVDNASVIVTELVTNAVLHGAPPVLLRISGVEGEVRIEVQDSGRSIPVQARRSTDMMTGRGLELVAALANDWGVEPGKGEGKVVWAHVTGKTGERPLVLDVDIDQLLSAWKDSEPAEQRFTVRLGAVPTDLLLAAKAHIDNVVRELTLMHAEEASTGVPIPAPMAALVTAVTEEFTAARAEIKRQALEAAARGDDLVDLVLSLPLSAAAAGERYLAALDEADHHARAARLLTLAPPQSHRAFRQWYVGSLVEQLRAAARGDRPVPARPFSQVLADEVDRLAALEESWTRLQLLQKVTSDLTGVRSVADIARTAVDNAAKHPGVETARVYRLTERRTLLSIGRHGSGADQPDPFDEFSVDDDLPGAIVVRTGKPMFLRSLAQIYARFPLLAGYYPSERSLHIVPLTIHGHTLGLLALTFVGGEVTDDAQLAFVQAIADVLAQALDHALANERADAERGRERTLLGAQLDVLTAIIAESSLGAALDGLLRAVEQVSPHGMLASVLLLDEDGSHLRHCSAPSLPSAYNDAIDGVGIGPAVGSCGTAAYRREQVIVEDIDSDPLWTDFRDLAREAGLRACWSTPIVGRDGRLLGTFALYYPQPQRPGEDDFALIDVLVRTVTMAIERSRADEERERAFAAERDAALTLQHSLLPAVPHRVGGLRLEARYRTGDPDVDVGGDWFDAIDVDGGAVLVVGDVQGHDLQAAALMGQLRTVARACVDDGQSPAGVLNGLRSYLSRIDTELLTTAVVLHLNHTADTATVASAGHLPPMLLQPTPEGGWRASDVPIEVGPPLGLGTSWEERRSAVPPGSVLLLYTDGLVETRTWPLDHGLDLLRATLESLPRDVGLAEALDAVLELVPTGSRGDDVAVLAAATPALG